MIKHKLIFVLLLLSLHGRGQQSDLRTDLRSILASGTYPNIDGVIISQNEHVLFEEYFNGFARDSLHDTRSSFKSITSLLTGSNFGNWRGKLPFDILLKYVIPILESEHRAGSKN